MKKALILLTSLVSASAFAETQPVDTRPMMKFGVYDTSNKVAREVANKKYSISNKNHTLCWSAFNMPFQPTNQVVEVFNSPQKAKFNNLQGSAVSAKDGKTHTISTNMPSVNNEFIERCWYFDKNDPVGKYTLELRVNNIAFPVQTFEVVK